jgi:predicted nucleotidyltransferase
MRFADLVAATSLDAALVAEIDALLEVKMRAGEAATSPRRVGIHDFIERELAVAEVHAFGRQARAPTQPLDDFLHDAVRHFDARP